MFCLICEATITYCQPLVPTLWSLTWVEALTESWLQSAQSSYTWREATCWSQVFWQLFWELVTEVWFPKGPKMFFWNKSIVLEFQEVPRNVKVDSFMIFSAAVDHLRPTCSDFAKNFSASWSCISLSQTAMVSEIFVCKQVTVGCDHPVLLLQHARTVCCTHCQALASRHWESESPCSASAEPKDESNGSYSNWARDGTLKSLGPRKQRIKTSDFFAVWSSG